MLRSTKWRLICAVTLTSGGSGREGGKIESFKKCFLWAGLQTGLSFSKIHRTRAAGAMSGSATDCCIVGPIGADT
jgi:hypothetical protein